MDKEQPKDKDKDKGKDKAKDEPKEKGKDKGQRKVKDKDKAQTLGDHNHPNPSRSKLGSPSKWLTFGLWLTRWYSGARTPLSSA